MFKSGIDEGDASRVECADMSALSKAATCRRTPNLRQD